MSDKATTKKLEHTLFFRRTAGPVAMTMQVDHFAPNSKYDLLRLRAGSEPFHSLHRYFVIGDHSRCGYGRLSSSRLSSFSSKVDYRGADFFGVRNINACVEMGVNLTGDLKPSLRSQIANIRLSHERPIADVAVFQVACAPDLLALSFSFKVLAEAGDLTSQLITAFEDERAATNAAEIMLKPFKYEQNRRSDSTLARFDYEKGIPISGPYHLVAFESDGLPLFTLTLAK